jgi:hypothetical protein
VLALFCLINATRLASTLNSGGEENCKTNSLSLAEMATTRITKVKMAYMPKSQPLEEVHWLALCKENFAIGGQSSVKSLRGAVIAAAKTGCAWWEVTSKLSGQ